MMNLCTANVLIRNPEMLQPEYNPLKSRLTATLRHAYGSLCRRVSYQNLCQSGSLFEVRALI